jgi:hypothetical protein
MAEQAAEALSAGRARLQRAAMLAAILAGVSPAGGNYPVATVAITGDGAGDQTVESPVAKILDAWVRSRLQPLRVELGLPDFDVSVLIQAAKRIVTQRASSIVALNSKSAQFSSPNPWREAK